MFFFILVSDRKRPVSAKVEYLMGSAEVGVMDINLIGLFG